MSHVKEPPPPLGDDVPQDLRDTVAALLEAAGERAPVLLVLDDLHWADDLSLQLLRHLLRVEAPMRLLLLATYRDTEPSRSALLDTPGFHGRGARRFADRWLGALEAARQIPDQQLPPLTMRSDAPPAPRVWAERDPVAAGRLARARSIEVTSVTGYTRRFDVTEAVGLWLVTACEGRALTPGTGAPVRLVAPRRRGFWWVKWVATVRLSDRPAWAQLPFPPQ